VSATIDGNGAQGRGRIATGEPIWDRLDRPLWMRLVNGAGRALRRVGLRRPRLDPEEFLAIAERRTGLSDWGDDRFREGLKALVEAFERQDTAHTFGRIVFRGFCIQLLVNRLRIEDELKRHPEILEVPIRRPVFVTGLPRSGTTLLHRLLAQNPAARPLLFWEASEPAPPPRPETYRTDPRIERVRKAVNRLYRVSPRIAAAHEFDAEMPEECNNLFAHGFEAGIFGFLLDVPGYVEWLRGRDLVGPYRYVRRQLQLLSRHIPGDPWVLKAPAHLFGLDALLTVFPDASIIVTHRDPLQVIPSLCSLASSFRGVFCERVDLRRLGAEFTEAMAVGVERALALRATADPARFLDVSYPALLADPAGTVETVCRHFGDAYDAAFEARVRGWLADNPQHKHGVHRYSLEQFGLDPGSVNARFATYRRWMEDNLPDSLRSSIFGRPS
jgi:hypothetical protein